MQIKIDEKTFDNCQKVPKKNGHKNKKTADQNKMLSGKMDTITKISARTRTENREWRKIWLQILKMTRTLNKNRENHQKKRRKICKNAKKSRHKG